MEPTGMKVLRTSSAFRFWRDFCSEPFCRFGVSGSSFESWKEGEASPKAWHDGVIDNNGKML